MTVWIIMVTNATHLTSWWLIWPRPCLQWGGKAFTEAQREKGRKEETNKHCGIRCHNRLSSLSVSCLWLYCSLTSAFVFGQTILSPLLQLCVFTLEWCHLSINSLVIRHLHWLGLHSERCSNIHTFMFLQKRPTPVVFSELLVPGAEPDEAREPRPRHPQRHLHQQRHSPLSSNQWGCHPPV